MNPPGNFFAGRMAAFAFAALLSMSARATPIELITNGGFETGALSGWTAISSNPDVCCWDTGWNVASSALNGGAYSVADPLGSYAAYEAFDGAGPKTRTLMQGFVVPDAISQATLSFSNSWYVTTFHGGTLPRAFDAYLVDGLDTYNVYHLSTPNASALPFALQALDVTSFLQGREGHSIELSFVTTIPEYGTGPGGLGLDNVSLVANVPEPSTAGLLALVIGGLGIFHYRRNSGPRRARQVRQDR